MALIIDTETTGLPNCKGLSFGHFPAYDKLDHYDNARIVQISMMICNEKFEQITLLDFIVKREGFVIENSKIHGITNDISDEKGIPFSNIVPFLSKHLKQVSHIVAHNASFDVNVILSELHRLNMTDVIEEMKSKRVLCTMKHTKYMVGIRRPFGIKYPSLAELYEFVCKEKIENAHNSVFDVINLHKIVKQMYDRNTLDYPEELKYEHLEEGSSKRRKVID